ncbi:MAG: VWA domain-containing protein [Acidobacteria bacterium]|nr:VWA domain-containing protein [Acidobacteriota bacterium]
MRSLLKPSFSKNIFFAAMLFIIFSFVVLPAFVNAQKEKAADEQEALKLNSTLIQIPAVVLDRAGKFIPDLAQKDFAVFEDGKRQEVAFFTTIKQPFNAVLVLDTSNSSADRLRAIQQTATGFTRELSAQDKMMVIAFDNEVRQLTDFTADQNELQEAITGTESGYGKLLYEAIAKALEQLKETTGRRAVILFSDGVDMKSIEASLESNIKLAEEVGAVIYVVHFDTRWWIEADARKHQTKKPEKELPFDVDVRIPLPPEYGGPDLTPAGMPRPRIEIGARPSPPIVYEDGFGNRRSSVNDAPKDAIATQLDSLYGEADEYMKTLTSRTGGALFEAGNFEATRSAFATIAEELRHLYVVGYYPKNEKRDGKFHKLKIEVTRKEAHIRARSGYR